MTSYLTPMTVVLAAVAFFTGCTLLGGSATAIPTSPTDVLWVEGEQATQIRAGLESNTHSKAPASGGLTLSGGALANTGDVAAWAFDLTQPVPEGRVTFRYARLHWRETMVPARMTLTLTGPDAEPVTREVTFENTGGWGDQPQSFRLLSVDVSPLTPGRYRLQLRSEADLNDVVVDGFFVTPTSFNVSADELDAMIRVQITSAGYVGLQAGSLAIDQTTTHTVAVARRAFTGPGEALAVSLAPAEASGATHSAAFTLEPANKSPGPNTLLFAIPAVKDGPYTLRIACARPEADLSAPLIMVGDFLSSLDERLDRLAAFSARIDSDQSPPARRTSADLDHAVQYVRTGRDSLRKSTAAAVSNWQQHLAAQEGSVKPAPLAEAMRRALTQSEETMSRLEAGKDPYADRYGDLRRAYRSAVSGDLQVYRSFVPSSYAKAASVPFILMLHGGGGDENYFPEMERGKILEIAEKRGYVLACPKWHRRNNPNWMADAFQLIEIMQKEYPKIDPNRIYVTGISMGGGGTYLMATERPATFAAACCVSGTGDVARVPALANLPLMILQGDADTVVNPAGAKAVAKAMTDAGYTVDLHVFPTYGHNYHAEEYFSLTLDFFEKYRRR